jgi:hypothetical protein
MVASWVSQASFEPPGITVAVAKDRAIEALLQVGDMRSSAPPRAAMPTSDHAPHCTLVAARTHARRHVASASRHAFAAE